MEVKSEKDYTWTWKAPGMEGPTPQQMHQLLCEQAGIIRLETPPEPKPTPIIDAEVDSMGNE